MIPAVNMAIMQTAICSFLGLLLFEASLGFCFCPTLYSPRIHIVNANVNINNDNPFTAAATATGRRRIPLFSSTAQRSDNDTSGQVISSELDTWRDFDQLRGGLDFDQLQKFFVDRPKLVFARLYEVITIAKAAKDEWDTGTPDPAFAEDGSYEFDYIPEDDMGVRDEDKVVYRGTKLVERMSSLGPVAVKIGQTLSQRSDIVGDEVCYALKRLQTANVPFENNLAIAVMKESLNWSGPIAPNLARDGDEGEPLFAWMSEDPIATASLGQVYKATTHEGLDVAVKVQRPDGMCLLAKDSVCFKVALAAFEFFTNIQPGKAFDKGLIGNSVERVSKDMSYELDYYKEAESGVKFEESLRFLGFVKTPNVVEQYSSERVLVTEFVKGDHLNKLSKEEGLAMTRMAVEACTASLVLTGFVHADPHEGNLMLDEDGNIVFLDFGLMSDVDDTIMEAFAQGIQACLAEDWESLTKAFKSSEFISSPIEWKVDGAPGSSDFVPVGYDPVTGEDLGIDRMSEDLRAAMSGAEGGTSRFGALAEVLNSLSEKWKMQTPPYVLLLIRTFLTLEGIAGRVDPNFNIYEMAMPWAIRRSLSPSTMDGIKTLRSTILMDDGRIQWSRFVEMIDSTIAEKENEETKAVSKSSDDESTALAAVGEEGKDNETVVVESSSTDAAKARAMNDAVVTLLGSPEGVVLRRVIKDLDSIDLVGRLLSKDAKSLRKQTVLAISAEDIKRRQKKRTEVEDVVVAATTEDTKEDAKEKIVNARPMSIEATRLRERQMKWARTITTMLLQQHLLRTWKAGPKAWLKLGWLSMRLVLGLINQRILFYRENTLRGLFQSKSKKNKTTQLA